MKALVVAHRGASREFAANTIDAFARAIQLGADMIELDVRRTLDGVLIVQHDPRYRGLPIDRWTYPDLVTAHRRTVRRLGGRIEGGPVATLEEVLALCAGKIRVDIELKEEGYESAVLDAALRHLPPGDFVVTSFLDGAIAASKRARPEVVAGLLVGSGRQRPRAQLQDLQPFERAQRCGADFVAPYHLLATERFLTRCATQGLPVLLWTVNRPRRLARFLADPRVGGIITDVPAAALEMRGRVGVERTPSCLS